MRTYFTNLMTSYCAYTQVWALRAGLFWPFFWVGSAIETLLLRDGLVDGGKEWRVYNALKSIVLVLMAVFNTLYVIIEDASTRNCAA